jgi:uncharacterized protein YyaL (SSP411 family)
VLGDDAALFESAYGVTGAGNFEGRTILARVRDAASLAAEHAIAEDDVEEHLASARGRLLARRSGRSQPGRDDKALAAWNGLAVGAFAEAAMVLEGTADPDDAVAATRYRDAATRAAAAILDGLGDRPGRLRRSWKDGRASSEGVLEDSANLAEGLLTLYEATFDERWFGTARELLDAVLERFADPAGGFFDTAEDHERLVARPKDLQDNAAPAGGSMAARGLLRLAALTGESRYRTAADGAIAAIGQVAVRYPTGFANWLTAMDAALADTVEVAIVEPAGATATGAPPGGELARTATRGFHPNRVVAATTDPDASSVPLLDGRALVGGAAAAYVCRGFLCRMPVTTAEALAAELATAASAPA